MQFPPRFVTYFDTVLAVFIAVLVAEHVLWLYFTIRAPWGGLNAASTLKYMHDQVVTVGLTLLIFTYLVGI